MRLPNPDKPLPTEEVLEKLRSKIASDRITLYVDLKKILGPEKGEEVFKQLWHEQIMRIRKNFKAPKLAIGDLMKRELVSFPVMGFELYIDHEVEDGEDVYYEHLTKCPFLEMTKKMGISEIPCEFICKYDVELAIRDKRGRWETISRQGDGKDECLFRIREWKD